MFHTPYHLWFTSASCGHASLLAQPVKQIVLIFLCNIELVQYILTMHNISQVQYISPMCDMGLWCNISQWRNFLIAPYFSYEKSALQMCASLKEDTSLDETTHKRLCPSLGTSIPLSVCIRSCVRPQIRPFVCPSIGPLVCCFNRRDDHDYVALEVSMGDTEAWLGALAAEA